MTGDNANAASKAGRGRGLPRGSTPGRPKARGRLARFVDEHQAAARYLVTAADLAGLEGGTGAITAARQRLVRAGRLATIGRRRGLWVIVPLEYRAVGAPPATWVLDDVMRALDVLPYYVGIRSAAEFYGATHYALQVLQVVVARQVPPMRIGRERLRFVVRADASRVPVRLAPRGVAPLRVSTPEATALDLVRYMGVAGGISHVAGCLLQMRRSFDGGRWSEALEALADVANAQRLGYLLSSVGERAGADACAAWLATRRRRRVPLEHGAHAAPSASAVVDPTWKVALNAVPDLTL